MSRVWTCRGCGSLNQRINQRCPQCRRKRPPSRRPSHAAVLDERPYEWWVDQFGETCGICGAGPGTKRLQRDHDHHTGAARGLLCFRCNAGLRNYMTAEWLAAASEYLEAVRTAA